MQTHVTVLLLETPTNEIIIEEPPEDKREEESDLFSGAKEMEAYKQESLAVKRDIQMNLGRRSGPRWSLPHQNSLSCMLIIIVDLVVVS